MTKVQGKIIKIVSNLYTVEYKSNIYETRARGKFRNDKVTPLVGDFVIFENEDNYILEILPRKNELKRPPIANIDIAVVLTSLTKPDISYNLLDKELVCILKEGIKPIIVLSKTDLIGKDEKKEIFNKLKWYKKCGFEVITNKQMFRLKHLIKNKTVCFTGQTGAGKSTLLNKLDKTLNLNTSPISEALGRGVHTTRHVELFKVGHALIADTPGFSSLDINIDKALLKNYYPEFKGVNCKFKDCMHVKEKGCVVKELVESGKINKDRYDNYVKFWSEL